MDPLRIGKHQTSHGMTYFIDRIVWRYVAEKTESIAVPGNDFDLALVGTQVIGVIVDRIIVSATNGRHQRSPLGVNIRIKDGLQVCYGFDRRWLFEEFQKSIELGNVFRVKFPIEFPSLG